MSLIQFNSSSSKDSNMTLENIYRSPEIRKKILRNVYINAQSLQNNVNNKTIGNLERIINKADAINQEANSKNNIKDQSEVLLDSEIMTISSNVLKKCTFSLSKNISCYNFLEFSEKIKNFLYTVPDTILDKRHDWSLIESEILSYFKQTATFSIILGTLQLIPRKEIVRRIIVKESQAFIKRPENILFNKIENSVEQTVVEIIKILGHYQKHNKKPLDFFTLVLHPTDFGKTVENVLHVSFLIRDGIIQFTTDGSGVPQLQKISKNGLTNTKENKNKKNIQNVLTLNMSQWRALVQAYNIEKPMIDGM